MNQNPNERRERKEEALRMIHNGRLEQTGVKLNQAFAISREKQNPLPKVEPDRLAEIAASLYPHIRDPREACRHAATLLRFAQLTLEEERAEDERLGRYLEVNEANSRWPRILGEEIEAIQKGKGRKTLREKHEDEGKPVSPPFPISRAELVSLLAERGMPEKTVYEHLNKNVEELLRERLPGLSSREIEKLRKAFTDGPIEQPDFLQLVEKWDLLRETIEDFSGKK